MPQRLVHIVLAVFLLLGIQKTVTGQEDYVSKYNQQLAVDLILDKAQLALQSAQYNQANDLITSATDIAKDSTIYAQALMMRISYYNNTNQLELAKETIVKITPYFKGSSIENAKLLLLNADVLIQSNALVEAEAVIAKTRDILYNTKNKELLSLLKLRTAQLDLKTNNLSNARVSFIELLQDYSRNQQHYSAAKTGIALAKITYKNDELELSKNYITNSIQLAEKHNLNNILKDGYQFYAQLLKQEGDYQNSILYLEKYTELTKNNKPSVSNDIALIELKKLKEENQELLLSNSKKAKKLKGHDTSYILLCVFITLLSLLTLSLFKNNKLRAKSNNVLEDKNSALIDERDRAQDAAKIKADFLSTITHELRTPMYAVTGLTHLLLETEPRNDQKEHLETLQSSGEYLLSLIDNILDFNKLEANKVELEAIPFDLNKRVNDISLSLKGQANDQDNRLHIQYDNIIPSRLQGDPVKISQILINLIGNAIKFTKNGDIWVRVKKVNTTSDKCLIYFEVEDNGKGISEEKQQAIFENFTQEGTSTTREYGGTGLGLAIVKNLVELMGGTVQLDSKIGQGSKFSFEIWFDLPDSNKFFNEHHFPTPLTLQKEAIEPITTTKVKKLKSETPQEIEKIKEQKEEVISTKPATPTELLNKRILIVEDNKINQMITRKILEGKNFTCEVANNGDEAIKALKTNRYDLILMDIHMPIKDGKEATKEIRAFDREIPIIALTAVTLDESEKEFYEIGFDDIIPKPFKMDEFFEKIQKAFTNYEVL